MTPQSWRDCATWASSIWRTIRASGWNRHWALGPDTCSCEFLSRKRHKNRLHLDLRSEDLEGEVSRLVDRGAVELYRIDTNVTMADPEGNEFCTASAV